MFFARRLLACTIVASFAASALAQNAPANPAAPAANVPAKRDPQAKPAENLPTPQELQEKFLKATGGREAHEKVKARICTGTVEIVSHAAANAPPQTFKGTMTTKILSPDKVRLITELDVVGRLDQGSNGAVAWELNPNGGPRLLNDAERAQFLRITALQTELRLFDAYPTSKTVGIEKVNDRDAYHVDLTAPKGETIARYYDRDSGLLIKYSQPVKTPIGEITAEVFLENYKDVGPIKVAHTNRTTFEKIEQTVAFSSIESPTTIPDEAFAPPPEVQQLIDEAAKADKKPGDGKPADKAVDPKK